MPHCFQRVSFPQTAAHVPVQDEGLLVALQRRIHLPAELLDVADGFERTNFPKTAADVPVQAKGLPVVLQRRIPLTAELKLPVAARPARPGPQAETALDQRL